MTIRVLVVDDEPLVRLALRELLSTEPSIRVIGEAPDGAVAVDEARRHRPDVVLMDIRMPVLNGIDATAQITAGPAPRPRVIILTTYDLDEYVFDGLRAGASGFLLKDAPPTVLEHAVRVVARGEAVLAPSVTKRLIGTFLGKSAPADVQATLARVSLLTDRERAVFEQLVEGRSNSEIAEELFISRFTVKVHVANILAKLQLRDRVHAVLLGRHR